MTLIQQLEKSNSKTLGDQSQIRVFRAGDTPIVNVKVVEGERTRVAGPMKGPGWHRPFRRRAQRIHRSQYLLVEGRGTRFRDVADDRRSDQEWY